VILVVLAGYIDCVVRVTVHNATAPILQVNQTCMQSSQSNCLTAVMVHNCQEHLHTETVLLWF
jgi:hypothetical protein